MAEREQALRVAVVGQFSSGKSALINALLGERIAPMGVTPVTAVLHRFHWADPQRAVIERIDGTLVELDPTDLAARPLDEGQLARVREIRVGLPRGILRDIEVWDTPGFGSNTLAHELVARRALIDADIVLWVTPIDHALDRGEADKLTRLRHADTPVLLVVNKADLADDAQERDEAVADIAAAAGSLARAVVWASALLGLRAAGSADAGLRAASGFDKLEPMLAELAAEGLKRRRDAILRAGSSAVRAHEVLCPACGAVGRFDDSFCVCGRSLADQHRACPRCGADNTVQRPRCRGCNLVFDAWERARDLAARAEQEISLGLLTDAAATLALALEAMPDDKALGERRDALEQTREKVAAWLRAADRQTTGARFFTEIDAAARVLKAINASTGPFWREVEALALSWAGAKRPAEQVLHVLDRLIRAGVQSPEVLRLRREVDEELGLARREAEEQRRKEEQARKEREAVERKREQERREVAEQQRREAERVAKEKEEWARRGAEALAAREKEERARREAEEAAQIETEGMRLLEQLTAAETSLREGKAERDRAQRVVEEAEAALNTQWSPALRNRLSAAGRQATATRRAELEAALQEARRGLEEVEATLAGEQTAHEARSAALVAFLRPHRADLPARLQGHLPPGFPKTLYFERFEVEGVAFRMRDVAPRHFQMGSDDGDPQAESCEKPRHLVTFEHAYQIGEVPVTQALWQAVMGMNPSHFQSKQDSPRRPVECVTWYDAVRFCNELSQKAGLRPAYRISAGAQPTVEISRWADGFRLPSEAEWECAAQAGQRFSFSGSDNPDEVAWHRGNSGGETHAVSEKRPNAWGLSDMSGNVWEFVGDRFHANYAYAPADGSAWVSPVDSAWGRRGGSHNDMVRFARITYRSMGSPGFSGSNIGFRLARSTLSAADAVRPRDKAAGPTTLAAPTPAPRPPAGDSALERQRVIVSGLAARIVTSGIHHRRAHWFDEHATLEDLQAAEADMRRVLESASRTQPATQPRSTPASGQTTVVEEPGCALFGGSLIAVLVFAGLLIQCAGC